MRELIFVFLVISLFILPALYGRTLTWRISLSKVSTLHHGNTEIWEKGTGSDSLELYTPHGPEVMSVN